MKLRDYFSKKASAKNEPPAPPGQQTDWLDFCEFVLKGNKVLCVDAQFAPSAEDGLLVDLSPGKYLLQAKCVDYGGDKRVARLRLLPKKIVASLGAQLGETWTDTAKTGVCDYDVFSKAWGTDDDASYEKISPAFETEKPFGKATLDKASSAILPFLDSGFGDGTFPVFELVADGKRVGLEIQFIAEGTPYPFGETPLEQETRIQELKSKAEQGDGEAQWEVGKMYYNGKDVEKDIAEAVNWFERGAAGGHAEAANTLGFLFQKGNGVTQSYQRALELYEAAAAKDLALALNNLGVMHRHGYGVPVNLEKAVKYYQMAAEKGSRDAQFNLGVHYQYGFGITKNVEEAVRWYRLAADQRQHQATGNLGYCYLHGLGVPQDYKEAVRLFERAALFGNNFAANNLGHCYELGLGVEQDFEKAFSEYSHAAAAGLALAKCNLGSLIKRGLGVKARDPRRALQWFREAAELGCADADYELGLLHEEGEVVKTDQAAALRFYQKSAEKGHEPAVKRLAELEAERA